MPFVDYYSNLYNQNRDQTSGTPNIETYIDANGRLAYRYVGIPNTTVNVPGQPKTTTGTTPTPTPPPTTTQPATETGTQGFAQRPSAGPGAGQVGKGTEGWSVDDQINQIVNRNIAITPSLKNAITMGAGVAGGFPGVIGLGIKQGVSEIRGKSGPMDTPGENFNPQEIENIKNEIRALVGQGWNINVASTKVITEHRFLESQIKSQGVSGATQGGTRGTATTTSIPGISGATQGGPRGGVSTMNDINAAISRVQGISNTGFSAPVVGVERRELLTDTNPTGNVFEGKLPNTPLNTPSGFMNRPSYDVPSFTPQELQMSNARSIAADAVRAKLAGGKRLANEVGGPDGRGGGAGDRGPQGKDPKGPMGGPGGGLAR